MKPPLGVWLTFTPGLSDADRDALLRWLRRHPGVASVSAPARHPATGVQERVMRLLDRLVCELDEDERREAA